MSLGRMGRPSFYDPSTRALWDQLNAQQAALWRVGKVDTPEYNAIIDQMGPLAPPGIAGWFAGGRGFGGNPDIDPNGPSLAAMQLRGGK